MSFHAENPARHPTGANHSILKRLYTSYIKLDDVNLRRLVTILLVLHARKLRGRTQSENKKKRKDGGDFLSSMVEIILPSRLRMVIVLINLENYPQADLT